MTRMIPETIHSSVQSTAEKRIFEVIRDAPQHRATGSASTP